jgi:hypothetical protein
MAEVTDKKSVKAMKDKKKFKSVTILDETYKQKE